VLLEFSSGSSEAQAQELAESTLGDALSAGFVEDAVLAASLEQARSFWHLASRLSDAQKPEGASVKHDVSIPVQSVPDFLDRTIAEVSKAVPGVRPVPFGHMGDGNIHFNFSQPPGATPRSFSPGLPTSHAIVHGIVAEMGGSISAEHGIGRYKRALLSEVKSEIEMDLMRRIKAAFDPNGILNPGKVL
jgi:FAD/FMN-containing dehydrogenase